MFEREFVPISSRLSLTTEVKNFKIFWRFVQWYQWITIFLHCLSGQTKDDQVGISCLVSTIGGQHYGLIVVPVN
jgi:hypothetical protein